ncbi:protein STRICTOSIDINE SYNTHASE-LIKE 4-like [Tasmannia lanceolata]|uniref:protein STRICTOSIDINE SYNTHASE-LIKE 4-like n=1 Tax=Tasmannia lanceolata TaxID=3420 RepID=UPI004062B65B
MFLQNFLSPFTGILLVCLLAIVLQIVIYSPISPDLLELPPVSLFQYTTNNILQTVEKIGEGVLEKPEDVYVDKEGTIYTATRDGWIKRMHKNGSWEDWKMIGGPNLLGISMSVDGDILVCDPDKGLLKVGEDSVTVLASEVEGSKIRFADDVIEASDGSVYFSDASTKFGLHEWTLDFLEAKPHGRLLKYDPSTKKTSVLLPSLCFANGVALSQNEDFLVVCETWKFRCLKYWLKGELQGKTEIFIENLPGGPDNINLAEDGSFWIALLHMRSWEMDFVHRSKAAKHLMATFPKLIELTRSLRKKATVVNVGDDGKILNKFDDSNGKVISFVTSAVEFKGHLYLGSLESNFIGRLQLNRSTH